MSSNARSVAFIDPGPLTDGELALRLCAQVPGEPDRGIVPQYRFDMVRHGGPHRIGTIHLRLSLTPRLQQVGGHIAYGVYPRYRGHHYEARSIRLLLPLARRLGLSPLLITCGVADLASRKTCQFAGDHIRGIRPVEVEPGAIQLTCYYEILP